MAKQLNKYRLEWPMGHNAHFIKALNASKAQSSCAQPTNKRVLNSCTDDCVLHPSLPTSKYNRCNAVAPHGVGRAASLRVPRAGGAAGGARRVEQLGSYRFNVV